MGTQAFVDTRYVESVQLWSPLCSNAVLHAGILDVDPQETWDLSNLTLFHDEEQRLSGYVKIHGVFFKGILNGSRFRSLNNICLVLSWGFEVVDFSEPNHIQETFLAGLCWVGDWG